MLILYEDKIIDAHKWLKSNPELENSITKSYIYRQEISRYIYGAFPLPHSIDTYQFKEAAVRINEGIAGELVSPFNLFYHEKNSMPVRQSRSITWKLIDKYNLNNGSNDQNCYIFQSEGVKVKKILPGIESAGRYYTLCSCNGKIMRNYGLFMMLRKELLSKFLTFASLLAEDKLSEWNDSEMVDPNEFENTMNFFIKTKSNHSKLLSEIDLKSKETDREERQFKIIGPFGHGFQLATCPKGTILIIALGVGIAMWIDVIAYIIRRKAFLANTKYFFKGETFDFDDSQYKFVVHCSYKDGDRIGIEILGYLNLYIRNCRFPNFEFYTRVTTQHDKPNYYTRETFKSFEGLTNHPSRVYLIGPQQSIESISSILLSMGMKDDIIYRV